MNTTEIGYRLVTATGNLMQTLAGYHWGERELDRDVLAGDFADIMTLLGKAATIVGSRGDWRVLAVAVDTSDELQMAYWLVEVAGMLDEWKPHPGLGTTIITRVQAKLAAFAMSYKVDLT